MSESTGRQAPGAFAWLRALADHLAQERPGNGTRVLAVAAVLVMYANPDGTQANVGQRRIAAETCQHVRRVTETLRWLEDQGWLRIEGRAAHGGHRRTLMIASSVSTGGNADRSSVSTGGNADRADRSSVSTGGYAEPPASQSASQSAYPPGDTNLRPPTVREEEEGGRKAAPERGSAGATPLGADHGDEVEALPATGYGSPLLAAVVELVPEADETNTDIRREVARLAAGGWQPDQLRHAWRPLPRRADHPTGLVLLRLRNLPTDPAESVRLQTAGGPTDDGRWHMPAVCEKCDQPIAFDGGGPMSARRVAEWLDECPDDVDTVVVVDGSGSLEPWRRWRHADGACL